MKHIANTKAVFIFLMVVALSAGGCTVRYVAEYDASVKEEIVQVAKKVDLFWGVLLDTDTSQREYDKFKGQYNRIETDIRGLVMRNEIRPQNEESTKQANIALKLWVQDRNIHKKSNTFSDFEARSHRKQFTRVFTAMAKGEDVKDMGN